MIKIQRCEIEGRVGLVYSTVLKESFGVQHDRIFPSTHTFFGTCLDNGVVADRCVKRTAAYAAAKGGLKMLTQNMATEWARFNIQANGIGPGYFATEQTAPIRVDGHPMHEFIVNRTPAGKWGEPEQLKGAAIFLASEASDFMTGHDMVIDGGYCAW